MTAGDVYTVAGLAGFSGTSGNGGPSTSALLSGPNGVAIDSSGNLYIADANNNRVQKVSASTGNISTFAGSASGTGGNSGQGGVATSARLDDPFAVATDTSGDVFIASLGNNQAYEVPAASGTQFGITMTAGHIYTIAGSTAETSGSSGDGGPATSSLLDGPQGLATDASGNVYVSDTGNNRIQEIAVTTHSQWGVSMTAGDVYSVAGSASASGLGDGGPATAAGLAEPVQIAIDSSGDLYIADGLDGVIREVAGATGTQWAQAMTAGDIYTVVSTSGSAGTADGVPATSIDLGLVQGIGVDPFGDLFVTNEDFSNPGNSHLREVVSGNGPLVATSPAVGATWSTSGITITQPGGSQITFYPKSGGSCVSPYVAAGSGGYCALPQYTDTNLTFSSGGGGTYTYTPSPGLSYTYGSAGALQSETDSEGDSATITYASPAPGAGNCPATATTCNTITSASGRALVIGYNSSNLVTSATDPMGRRWTYTYTGSDLTKATDPLGNITTYTYDTSNANAMLANDMLTITGPNAQPGGPDAGDDTVNAYDSLGRVTSQTDPMGNTTHFNYCVNAVAGDCMDTVTGTGFTTVTDPDGNTTVDSYQAGSLTGTADYTGGTSQTSARTYLPDQSGTGASADTQLDTADIDGNGMVTVTGYDSNGNATSTTMPDGVGTQTATTTESYTPLNIVNCSSTAEATTTCAASPGPSPVTSGGTITPPSSAPPPGLTWTLDDTRGNALFSTTGVYQPGSSSASYSQTTYTLYSGNSVTLGTSHITCAATPPSASLPCATINADGVVTQLAYDAQGDLTSTSTPDGNGTELATTTYGYDSDGERTSVTSPDGNVTGANAGNYTTVTAYDSDGEETSVSQGDGSGHTVTPRVTHDGYDADGNQTTEEDARGFTTTITFNADDEAALVSDPDGNQTLACYDGAGDETEIVPPVGVAANSLTAASCPTAYPAGYGNRLATDATTYTFDASGDRTQETIPAPAGQTGSETTSYTYDGNGDVLTTTAPPTSTGGSNQVMVNTYNSAGELATVTTGSGTGAAATVSYCYDPNGDKTSAVYGDGNASSVAPCETSSPWVVSASSHPTQAAYQTTYSDDSVGDLVSVTAPATTAAPSGATTTMTYDAAGNALTSVDPNGVTKTSTYTPLNQVATISYSGSSAHSVSYTYDASGGKTAMTDASGSSSYSYDAFGELTSTTSGAGQTTGYGYDANGTISSITYPLPGTATWATSPTVHYAVDNADLYTSVTDFNGNQISIGYTADELPNSLTLSTTGDLITTTYDNTDEPSLIKLKNSTTTLQSFSYSDAPAGNLLTETDTPSSSLSPASYTYDARGRVTSMTPGTHTALSYGFDASSNLTTTPTGATGSYDNAGELTSAALGGTTTNYTYDADGERLTAKQGTVTVASGSWNGAQELTAYNGSAANLSSATYDGTGLRTSATTGTTTQAFVWNLAAPDPSPLMDSANAYLYAEGSGTPSEQVNLSSGTVTYLVGDALGSVRGTVSSTGSLTASTSYDAWGNPETTGGLTAQTPFGYVGGYTDGTGLLYLINRYYDPATGQFLSLDPDVSQTLEPYGYTTGNPVSDTDPLGLFEVPQSAPIKPKKIKVTVQECNAINTALVNRNECKTHESERIDTKGTFKTRVTWKNDTVNGHHLEEITKVSGDMFILRGHEGFVNPVVIFFNVFKPTSGGSVTSPVSLGVKPGNNVKDYFSQIGLQEPDETNSVEWGILWAFRKSDQHYYPIAITQTVLTVNGR
jgi:RHS repeat-associated protein